MNTDKMGRGLVALACLVTWAGAAQAQAVYQFIDLGAVSLHGSEARGINQAGLVVGQAQSPAGLQSATVWSVNAPSVVFLNPLPGGSASAGTAISTQGRVVGRSNVQAGEYLGTAALWWNGSVTALGLLPGMAPGSAVTDALAVNDNGWVVGQMNSKPVAWLNGSPTLLPSISSKLPSAGVAQGLNTAGHSVGKSITDDTYTLPFYGDTPLPVYRATKWVNGVATDLGRLGGALSEARAINDAGTIVGQSDTDDKIYFEGQRWAYQSVATVWQGGAIKALTSVGGGSRANAINNRGEIVGTAGPGAVIWPSSDAAPRLLSQLIDDASFQAGWRVTSAEGINDQGWIAGTAYNANLEVAPGQGHYHAILLKPMGCQVTYKVTRTQLFTFSAEVTITNSRAEAATGWNVRWSYDATPYFYGVKNAKLTVASSRHVNAVPVAASQSVGAGQSVVFSFSSLKGKQVLNAHAMAASLGGEPCMVKIVQ